MICACCYCCCTLALKSGLSNKHDEADENRFADLSARFDEKKGCPFRLFRVRGGKPTVANCELYPVAQRLCLHIFAAAAVEAGSELLY